jgi:hypothetical protein
MKRFVIGLLCAVMLVGSTLTWAGDITETGMNQGDLVKLLTQMKDTLNMLLYGTGLKTDPNMETGSTNTTVSYDGFGVLINGTSHWVPAGTVTACANASSGRYAAMELEMTINPVTGTQTVACHATNETQYYSTEAAAIAALPDVPAGNASIGCLTVYAGGGEDFNAGVDGLGDENFTTTYYDAAEGGEATYSNSLVNGTLTLRGL